MVAREVSPAIQHQSRLSPKQERAKGASSMEICHLPPNASAAIVQYSKRDGTWAQTGRKRVER